MDDIELVDRILTLLRSLHETGWDYNVEGVLTSIAEVEGADKGYSDDQVTELAEKLIGVIRFQRKAVRFEEN